MKKILFVGVLFSLLIFSIPADELANCLHDLAIKTACVGVYTKANSRYDDPPDFYTPSMLANRFATVSGNSSSKNAFYGVCFDYAQYAWKEIKRNRKKFNDSGMKGTEWYIAIANEGYPNTIILYDPASKDNASVTYNNGVFLKEISRFNVYSHEGTSGHAWIWVKHNNGNWYWVDPTWTDNTGYVRWGIVENGREVQYNPISSYCVASSYPGASSTYIASNKNTNTNNTMTNAQKPSSTSTGYNYANSSYLLLGYNYINDLPVGFTIANSMFFDRSLMYISANCNTEFNQFEWICGISISVTNWLRIPVGIGLNHTGRDVKISTGGSWLNGVLIEEYYEDSIEWENKFVIEIGLQPVIFDHFYFSAAYRLSGFTKNNFSFGAGFLF